MIQICNILVKLIYIIVSKLVAEIFHFHSEPKLIELIPQQKSKSHFSVLTVVVDDKIQDRYNFSTQDFFSYQEN